MRFGKRFLLFAVCSMVAMAPSAWGQVSDSDFIENLLGCLRG